MKNVRHSLLAALLMALIGFAPFGALAGQIPVFDGTTTLSFGQVVDYTLTIQGNLVNGATIIWPSGATGQWSVVNSTNLTITIEYPGHAAPLPISSGTTQVVVGNGAVFSAGPSGGAGSSTIPVTTVSTSGSSQAIAFPSSGSAAYDITLTANCTITLSGGTSGQYQVVTLILRQNATAGWTPTLPTGIRWPGGIAPTPNTTAGNVDVFTLSTSDGGTTILGTY